MNLEKLAVLAEEIRKNVIGDPVWIEEKHVFEYPKQTREVVVILKLIRAIQGVKSQAVLCGEGLFIDMGALYRCVADCAEEIIFLLEEYPKESEYTKQFVKNFFEHTINNYDSVKTHVVPKKKIRSANVRFLNQKKIDENIRKKFEGVYKTFSGYIHAGYAHIMQSFGGRRSSLSFNLLGVLSIQEKMLQMQIVEQSYISVLHSMFFICTTFGQDQIAREANKLIDEAQGITSV